mmetsp:Transcript_28374/g.42977  ORF Transcript_28374/g.42977 Transcript_28374/m.42977 type:complete len:100 (+) Transcript_28374:1187-1486(+)
MLTSLHQGERQTVFTTTHPNLIDYMKKRMGASLTEEEFLMKEDKAFALNDYITNLSVDGLKKVIDDGIDLYYERVASQEQELTKVMEGMEIVTNCQYLE